jgi:N-acetylneuraminate synthase
VLKIAEIESESPTYFVADIAANHDGSLVKAKKLISLAARAGANAAKFQHFQASTIISRKGFDEIGKISHQSKWKSSVFDTYQAASLPIEWTEELKHECELNNIEFFTAPYSINLIKEVARFIPAFKVGSGDITWIDSIKTMCSYGKPILLATGASNMEDVTRAVNTVNEFGNKLILMQCNTNYTASEENNKYLNLSVLDTYKEKFPNAILGLSDHTTNEISVLASIALGARVIEKHFTDSNANIGPDHYFSLDPFAWEHMINNARKLEDSLGDGIKRVEQNEVDSFVIQRRGLRYASDLEVDTILTHEHLIALRPCLPTYLQPYEAEKIIGRRIRRKVFCDDPCLMDDFYD